MLTCRSSWCLNGSLLPGRHPRPLDLNGPGPWHRYKNYAPQLVCTKNVEKVFLLKEIVIYTLSFICFYFIIYLFIEIYSSIFHKWTPYLIIIHNLLIHRTEPSNHISSKFQRAASPCAPSLRQRHRPRVTLYVTTCYVIFTTTLIA